ncbi:hypothetical protein BDW59DRAFT_166270 [Aspergillus cavernicola]|uniref:SET domain-containing protein n=1 Tax=Aspergillus cavernicola TaxID=176166 RepID=A0ABR4HMA4_9EURO
MSPIRRSRLGLKSLTCIAYHGFEIPSNAPFELKPSPGKGWGAFATQPIRKGFLILTEKPVFVIKKPHEEITEGDIRSAFARLTPGQKKQFLCLRDNGSTPFTSMESALSENSFATSSSMASPVHGLYLLHSRFNHSCLPNCEIPETKTEAVRSFATRDINIGEEIRFCYEPTFQCRTVYERHEALRFVCDCNACLPGSFQRASNMRRRLTRGLQYLTIGHDLDGQNHGTSPAIIFDARLKAAAENLEIPLSARLIYNLLAMALQEEEGLMNDLLIARFKPSILATVSLFSTARYARIARLAMTQETWVDKFSIASRLWGLADRADVLFSSNLPRSRQLSV